MGRLEFEMFTGGQCFVIHTLKERNPGCRKIRNLCEVTHMVSNEVRI